MDRDIAIAVTAALVNLALTLLLPSLIKDSKLPFAQQIKDTYKCNRDAIVISSVLVVVFVYIALQITPTMQSAVYSPRAQSLSGLLGATVTRMA